MWKTISLITLCAYSLFATSQESINAAGGNQNSASGSISFTIGQIEYFTITNSDYTVSQGVQQPYEIFLVGLSPFKLDFSISVFPNPTPQFIEILVGEYTNQQLIYRIFDLQGKEIQNGNMNAESTIIDLSELSNSTYLINIFDQDGQFIQSFHIVKLNL